jgi:cobalt-zinc-cadmium efflux system membrane fusion protein
MDAHEPVKLAAPLKGLPRLVQLGIVAVCALVLIFALFVVPAAFQPATSAAPAVADAAPSDGSFQPSPTQWASLRIEPIKVEPFRPAAATDGKIAIDDDLVTPVYSPYSGRVTKLMARAGDRVRAGDPLFAIQASEFAQGQNDLISAAATLKTAHAQLNLAQTSEKRQHDLYLAQGGALKDWQQAQVDLATAQGNLHAAEIGLTAVRNRLRILGKSDAEINALESAANLAAVAPDAVVHAPISGTITQRQIGLGQNIVSASSGASSPVFSIGDLSTVWLVANAREIDAPLIHVGDPVEVRVLAYPGRVFKARITYVAPSIDPTIHRLLVRAEVDNADNALKPEMFASFNIITGDEAPAPAVPTSAVVYEGSRAHVWLADPGTHRVMARQIKVGRITDGLVEVLDGVKPGEQVVVSGSLFIDRAAAGD